MIISIKQMRKLRQRKLITHLRPQKGWKWVLGSCSLAPEQFKQMKKSENVTTNKHQGKEAKVEVGEASGGAAL